MEVTKRINKYLDRIFADGRTEVNSADLPLENDDDYVDSMFLLSRYKETSSYEIEFSEGSVKHGKYSIPKFIVRKRDTK